MYNSWYISNYIGGLGIIYLKQIRKRYKSDVVGCCMPTVLVSVMKC